MNDTIPTRSAIMERYERLKEYLGFSTNDLERAYMVTSTQMEEIAELSARADQAVTIAKHNLELATANAANRIRGPMVLKGDAVTRIELELKYMVPIAPDVLEAWAALTQAEYEAKTCTGLFTSMKEQGRNLGKATEMITSGYARPNPLNAQQRVEERQRPFVRPRM